MSASQIMNPNDAAERGEKIYQNRYKKQYEREHPGEFVAIDVLTEKAYISETPEGALDTAHADAPDGIFHLIQVGYTGAFRVTYAHEAKLDWI
ncbi:MAG: hypothetical protein ABSC77_14220 [Terracidiphilus sp.]|jgi:hypothetical protein